MIPLLTDPSDELAAEEFAGECYRVVSPVANDLPQVQWAKVALEHRGGRALLVVSTAYPINEPIMRVAVRAGCRVAMSREYTLFFDPVSIEAPTVADATSDPVETQARAIAARPPRSRPAVQHPVVPRKHLGSVARTGPSIASKRASETVAAPAPPVGVQAAKASEGSRLQVSRSIVDSVAAPVAPGAAPTAAAERETLKALEEETVVLQRRVAELSLTMERMDQELKAARAAKADAEKAAHAAAEQARAIAAAATPWSKLRSWADENWPLPVVFPALILLIAAMLLGQERRRATRVPAPINGTDAFDSTYMGDPSALGTLTAGAGGATSAPREVETRINLITRAEATHPA